MLLMIRAFSTRHPAMAFIPDVRLICHWLLFTSLCPSAVQPLEIHGRSDAQNHQRVRTRLPAANDTPLDDSSYCSPSLPGAWSVFGVVEIVLCYNNAVRQKPQRIDLYRAAHGRDCATHRPLDAPRNVRRNGQAQQAPAGYTPPHYAQHSGRVRLIWFSFSLVVIGSICRR